jgi:hypothetical protein
VEQEAARVTTQQDPFAAEFGDLPGPTHWPSLLPEDAGQSWAELREWVEQLVDRFGLETRVIPPCWYKHNALVEPLSALRDHERISFAPSASPTAAVDWFRALREVEHHLSQACARTQCSINEHRPDPLRTWQTDQPQWQAFVEADVRDREQQVLNERLGAG